MDIQTGKRSDVFVLPVWALGALGCEIQDDGRYLALTSSVDERAMVSGYGFPAKALPAKIAIIDSKTGRLSEFPVGLYSFPGSGVSVRCPWYSSWFVGSDQFCYVSAKQLGHIIEENPEDGTATNFLELVKVDLKTQKTTKCQFDGKYPEAEPLSGGYVFSVPDYLKDEVSTIGHESDLAHAFLHKVGVEYSVPPGVCDTEVTFSQDGSRFFMKMRYGTEAGGFLYGDLRKKEWRRIVPKEPIDVSIAGILWIPAEAK